MITCNRCGKQKEGVETGLCSHCGKFGNPISKELDEHEITVILESVKRFYVDGRISKPTYDSIKRKLKG